MYSTIKYCFRNSSPGPDRIHPARLKHLHPSSIDYLTVLLNKIFFSGICPPQWKFAHVVPIIKPNSDSTLPTSYRPISLTSVLAKLLEKILNRRLVWFLESNSLLDARQYGFRKNHSTSHALFYLQYEINLAFSNNMELIAIFFDLEKAYDMTWRHLIYLKMKKHGLTGQLPKYIQSFLSDRTFSVRIGNTFSDTLTLDNGVPQGSCISVTLFLLAINEIGNNVLSPLTYRIFADDFSLSIRSNNPNRSHRLLQETLQRIETWSNENGFRFSSTKTKMIIFRKNRSSPSSPKLKLYGHLIPIHSELKFLGLLFDNRLSWIPRIYPKS